MENAPVTQVSNVSETQLKQIKEQLERQVNPKNLTETIHLFPNHNSIQATLQKAANDFKTQTGREMTYSEMREMFG
jgi:hypothetical protein